jgi:hypothetical protein
MRQATPPETMLTFHHTKGLVRETLELQEGENRIRAIAYNFMFTKALKKVKTRADFVCVLAGHIANIDTLVRLNRREVTQDLRRRGVPKGRIDRNVFAVRKRVSVWKDAMKSVERMATQEGASWTDGYRAMLYRCLVPAERFRWYCGHLVFSVQDQNAISSVPLPNQ